MQFRITLKSEALFSDSIKQLLVQYWNPILFFFLAKQIVYGVANMKNRASEDVICSSVGTDQNWYFYFLQTHFLRNSSI